MISEPLEELDAGRSRERRGREPAQGCRRNLRAVRAQTEKGVGKLISFLPRRAASHDLFRDTAQVVDEEDPEADRDRPQLTHRQRLHLLVGAHHAPQALRLKAAVGMGDVGPGETQDPRVAREVALGQLGELAVVVRGQVVADLSELLVDDVEVVDQPLGSRRDRTFFLDGPGQNAVRLQQDAAVIGDSGPDRMSPPGRVGHGLSGRKSLSVLLQPLHAEELREDRLFEFGLRANPWPTATRRVWKRLVRGHVSVSAAGSERPATAGTTETRKSCSRPGSNSRSGPHGPAIRPSSYPIACPSRHRLPGGLDCCGFRGRYDTSSPTRRVRPASIGQPTS